MKKWTEEQQRILMQADKIKALANGDCVLEMPEMLSGDDEHNFKAIMKLIGKKMFGSPNRIYHWIEKQTEAYRFSDFSCPELEVVKLSDFI